MEEKSQLIKVKVTFDTEIVVENFYGDNPQKCAEDAVRRNLSEIICQEDDGMKVTVTGVITKKEQLPKGWSVNSLPWLPTIVFGKKNQEKKIEKFLK